MNTKLYSTPGLVAAACCLVVVLYAAIMPFPVKYGEPGTVDHIQYWAGLRAFADGKNIYNPDVMRTYEVPAGADPEKVIMLWSPPWTPLVLAPLMFLPIHLSAWAWGAFNLCAAFAAVILLWKSREGLPAIFLISGISLLAVSESLRGGVQYGQMEGLLMLGVSLLFAGLRNGRLLPLAVSVLILSLKPHLFILFGIMLLFPAFRGRAGAGIFYAAAAVCLLVPLVELLNPGLTISWIDALRSPPKSAVSVVDWHSSSFSDFLRNVFGFRHTWLRAAVPFLTCAVMLFFSFSIVESRRQPDYREYGVLMTLSLIGAPYSWHYDHAVLLVVQTALIFEACGRSSSEGRLLWAAAFGLNLFTMIVSTLYVVSFDQLFWYPFLTLGLCVISRGKDAHKLP